MASQMSQARCDLVLDDVAALELSCPVHGCVPATDPTERPAIPSGDFEKQYEVVVAGAGIAMILWALVPALIALQVIRRRDIV